tara:strand:+ start:192 stop:446 length:255 start_codon:yes stop_codon:yes gene_type:complete
MRNPSPIFEHLINSLPNGTTVYKYGSELKTISVRMHTDNKYAAMTYKNNGFIVTLSDYSECITEDFKLTKVFDCINLIIEFLSN